VSATPGIYYLHTDHLDTVQVITDADQQVVWRGEQKPFGEVTVVVNKIDNPLRFPGQYFDSETGLHYNYFRDYDPGTGRYIQSDPIGLNAGLNTYAYVSGNPLRHTDMYGLEMDCKWVTIKTYDKVSSELVERERGYYRETCFPVPQPTIGIPNPTSPKRRPGFPSPSDISFTIKCITEYIKTQDAKYKQIVEQWMKGYMQCTDKCTGEVTNHWSPDRPVDNPPKI
jgi:RHS repeat-associated protein